MSTGKVTIPTDENFVEGTKRIAALWGADAVRDCDGTKLPYNAAELAEKVYNTYFVVRGDNDWARKHPEQTHRTFLMSERVIATTSVLKINPMKGYFAQQIVPDWKEIKRWQVFDRTTGEEVETWHIDEDNGIVIVEEAELYHEYTVDFMAKVVWHPVQIYNYLTNNWTCEKQLMYDPAYTETAEYVKGFCDKWCKEHPETNVVRFTTFLYQFTLIFNESGKEKYVDWFGYTLACAPVFFDKFKKEYGYELSAEDIIDNGSYNNPFRVPTGKFLDFMDFVGRFVSGTMKELVDIVHKNGKETMMFLGDDWIGSEPYGKYFGEIGLDAVVGSVGGGVTVRMLAEIPHVKYHEGRFLPYFFPDTFFNGNEVNAVKELNKNWMTARRAMMRSPLDRMGFGGYLFLAAKFPTFVNRVAELCDEFRSISDAACGNKPYSGLTVAVLNCWGKLRSWMSHMVAHELWYQQIYSYQGVLEALSGMAVNVKFISFDDIKRNGIDSDIDVILNVGDAGTAYSGGKNWDDAFIVSTIRKWVAEGHGFIGVGEPTAYLKGGKFFQLSDVLGVDREKGFTLSEDKYNIKQEKHFITADVRSKIDYGEGIKNVYALNGAKVLDVIFSDRCARNVNVGEVMLSTNEYIAGRGVYIAGIPYSAQNTRLLLRSLFWVSHKEEDMFKAFSSNINTECTYYPKSNKYAIINNTGEQQLTTFYDIDGNKRDIQLQPNGIVWIENCGVNNA